MDAITTLAAPTQPAPPIDEQLPESPVLAVPAEVAHDAQEILRAGGVLSDTQRAMLDFERRWWRRGGAKEQAIRDTFGLTPTRYYQTLNRVLDLPEALVYDAALVHRLRRVRAAGRRSLD